MFREMNRYVPRSESIYSEKTIASFDSRIQEESLPKPTYWPTEDQRTASAAICMGVYLDAKLPRWIGFGQR